MKKVLISAAVAAACSTPFAVLAQAAPAAPAKVEPEYTITGNAGLFSDYRFRGYSQTDYNPALQGGFDFAHKSGFYLGNWNSNVNSNAVQRRQPRDGLLWRLQGDLRRLRPRHRHASTTTTPGRDRQLAWRRRQELGGLHRRFVRPGVAEVLLLVHGLLRPESGRSAPGINTKGSQYLDLTGTFDLGSGFGIVAHVGMQKVKNGEQLGMVERQPSTTTSSA